MVSPWLKKCGVRVVPEEERCCKDIIEFRRNSDKQPKGWFWSRIQRRVSILLLMGSQLAAPLLLQSSIVLDCRGWPAKIMVSNFMRFGKSHWPAPVRWWIHRGMFCTTEILPWGPKGRCFVPLRYYPEVPRGILGGLALEQFWMIHRVGQVYRFVPFLPSEVPAELVCKMWVCCLWNVSRSSSWGHSFINIMDLCQELDGQLFAAHHPYAYLNSWED